MSDYNSNNEFHRPVLNTTMLVIGIGLVILGCLMILEQLTFTGFGIRTIRYWPIIIVAVGVVKILESKFRGMGGWIIVTAGLLLFAHSISGQSIGGMIWPALLMIAGIFSVMHAVKRHRKVPPELHKSGDFVRGTAIFGGFNHKPIGGYFDGGEITAMFGGFELDLRQTKMKSDMARIDVFCLFGGGEIRIPEGWDVMVRASIFAGAVDNKTIGRPATDTECPKLLITGSIMFGGIDVK